MPVPQGADDDDLLFMGLFPGQAAVATNNPQRNALAGNKRPRPPPVAPPAGGTSSRQPIVVDLTGLPDTPSDDDEIQIVGEVRGHRRGMNAGQRLRPSGGVAQPQPQPQQATAPQPAAAAAFNARPTWHPAIPFPAPASPEAKGFKCSICMDRSEETSSTACGHVFCTSCITQSVKLYKKCPKCCKALKANQVHRIYLDA